jgi:hypothetical protein
MVEGVLLAILAVTIAFQVFCVLVIILWECVEVARKDNVFKFLKRNNGNPKLRDGRLDWVPKRVPEDSHEQPGSQRKKGVLAARLERGEELWSPGDSCGDLS